MRKGVFLVSTVVLLSFLFTFLYPKTIKHSKHDLSSRSANASIKTGETSNICVFCHTSHLENASAPMWNRGEGAPVYTVYDSSTLHSIPGQPDGASKLCLSCHDGTIALGRVKSRGHEFSLSNTEGGRMPRNHPANLGFDLSDDHPISFDATSAVNASPELRPPNPGSRVKYDHAGKVQCTTCHDPHKNLHPNFLVKSNLGGGICKTCHVLTGYPGISSHDISAKSWNGRGQNPWPHSGAATVADNSCMNCHRGHNAAGAERLLVREEERTCLACHNGSVGKDIRSLINRTSAHRVQFYRGIHDPAGNILSKSVHVECVDCHNPHRANASGASAPFVKGSLAGVSGMSVSGQILPTANTEFQVCLKCHGQAKYRVVTPMKRMFDTTNIRVAINPVNASFHAVAARGKSNWVPSLQPPFTPASRLYCTACHNSNSSARAGGSGPNGPHGSAHEYILERRYETADHTPWSVGNYALCFKCHNPNILLNDQVSGFEKHAKHIRGEDTPCSVCHDPHGSPNYPALLNFDTHVVFPNDSGELKFEAMGNKGYCYMNCHGKNHGPEEYDRK